MKKALLAGLLAFISTGVFAQQKVELKTALDSTSYAFGVAMGNSLKETMATDLKMDVFMEAMRATLKIEKTAIAPDAALKMQQAYIAKAQARIAEAWKAKNLDYLEKNKTRAGVTTTASGLQYEVMRKGTGTTSPTATDKVEVHYHGTLIDGFIFDSSVDRGQTITFGLNQVIKGWTEGLQYMKPGDKFKFYIPSNLGYGDRPAPGGRIKPGSTLIFEVELFKVNPSCEM